MSTTVSVQDFKEVYTEFTKKDQPDIADSDRLDSLNLDSLAMLEIIGLLEQRAGREVDEDELADIQTFADLIRIVNEAEVAE